MKIERDEVGEREREKMRNDRERQREVRLYCDSWSHGWRKIVLEFISSLFFV